MDPLAKRRLGKSGVELPLFGLGGAPLGELFVKVTEADAEATLQAAWDAGVRYYDTAPWYGRGQSEHRFGRFLYRQPRAEFVLSTKVGRVLKAPTEPGAVRSGLLVGRPAVRPCLRLQLRRDHARLRGLPAASRHEPHRPAGHPRPRLLAPRHRAQGRRPIWAS